MKALAERILKHPLKVIKCFHMPKLLAVEKNNFSEYSRREFFSNLHGNEILRRRSMSVNADFGTGASLDHLVGFHQCTIHTGQSHITKVAFLSKLFPNSILKFLLDWLFDTDAFDFDIWETFWVPQSS